MTVEELISSNNFNVLSLPDKSRVINGVYCGDLLSWVMGRAQSNNVWITIMSNINIVAVATLADVSCIILAENVTLEEDIVKVAVSKGINIISSNKSVYDLCVALNKLI